MKIDKQQIVDEALKLLDERGLDALTTRALAERLGVKQPALYWHFKDRRALLDAMNDAMEAKVNSAPPPPPGTRWQDYVFQLGQSFRHALMAYRDGARIHAGTRANRTQLDKHMRVLVDAGLPTPLAIQLLVSVGRLVVGWVLEEQAEASAPPNPQSTEETLAENTIRIFFDMGDDAAFEAGLRFLIKGVEAAVEMHKDGPAPV
jgi:TetR/AcrR family transcriptional regulator, tetracycline repressor protein